MSERGSSRSSRAPPENESVSHKYPAAASGGPTKPGLNVFVATISPVAASTRARSMSGGSCCAGDRDQRRYRLPPVTVSAGLVKTRPTTWPAGAVGETGGSDEGGADRVPVAMALTG